MKCCQINTNISQLASEDFWKILTAIRKANEYQPEATISDPLIASFLENDRNLRSAVLQAKEQLAYWEKEFPNVTKLPLNDLIKELHHDVLNFYAVDGIQPFVPLAAQGPWIVTSQGGVIYDAGAYGMLGSGHNPEFLTTTLCKPQVMANVKTVSLSQLRTTQLIKQKIRAGKCPYQKFMFVNSGTEAVAVAARIADANAFIRTQPGGSHAAQKIKMLSLVGSFHGRTQREALASDSTRKTYQVLASFRDQQNQLLTVEPNNLAELKKTFQKAAAEKILIEALFLEPVMGEGRAGYSITPEFYDLARQLTLEHGSMLIVDSIQAGLRCQGVLSILDYPGFESSAAPDVETFSKAVNAGQFPLSVIALSERAIAAYRQGTYGNTMTANPRGLDIAYAVMQHLSSEITANIRTQGSYANHKLAELKARFPNSILEILGTGLLFSVQVSPAYPIEGLTGLEKQIRLQGVNVIHSSGNRLRFTPWFEINKQEMDLIFTVVTDCLAQAGAK